MTPPKGGLGNGLAQLIPDDALEAVPTKKEATRQVSIDEIRPNPEQPREIFDRDELERLSSSLKLHGVLSPLVVRRHEGQFVLIAGERRWQAARMAGLEEVPVWVREADDGATQLELALVENLQRADLDAIEEARGLQRLIEEYGYTQEQVASTVGKERSTVANLLRLLKLPPYVQQAMRDGRISAGHARALLPLSDDEAIRKVLAKISSLRLNVRQTERLVADIVRTPVSRVVEERKREQTMQYAVKLLEDALATSVDIRQRTRGGGRIVIDYADSEDLQRLIERLQ